jgi:hypothetical protein
MLPFATAQAIVAIARPAVIHAVVIISDALLLPFRQGIVVGVVVCILSHCSEHLVNLRLRGSTSAYRVIWVLLDAADDC